MGNKGSSPPTNQNNNIQTKQIKSEPSISKTQQKPFFQQNPLQLAKDQQGRLHQNWSQVVKKSQWMHRKKTDQYVKKIAQQTTRIGSECNNRYGQDQTKLTECFTIVAEPIRRIERRGQQALSKLGRTANTCLLSNKKEKQCIEEVKKQLHGCLEDTLKQMQRIKIQQE